MKAAAYDRNGGPEVLVYQDVPDPELHPKGVVLRVEAIPIEGGDTLNRAGGALVTMPHVVGYQAGGTIVEVGAEVEHLRVGQRVATVNGWGSHAELRAVPARNAWLVPDGFDIGQAATIPVAFGTAHECLFEAGRLQPGETVLVQAGASGVGVAAIQLAKRAGATVIATASSPARLEKLKPLGLDHGIDYSKEGVAEAVRRLTGGNGADVVVDPVGGPTLQASVDSLAYRGRVATVGQAGRDPQKLDISKLMGGNQTIRGVFLGAEIMTDRVHDMIQTLIDEAARGELTVPIDRTFPLSEAAAAHAFIESRQAVGRVLLIP